MKSLYVVNGNEKLNESNNKIKIEQIANRSQRICNLFLVFFNVVFECAAAGASAKIKSHTTASLHFMFTTASNRIGSGGESSKGRPRNFYMIDQ